MEAALYDDPDGYYLRRDLKRWGRAGDYRTAPERSPLFAATFASYFARLYEQLDSPQNWTIVESGAGAGEFAHGVLQTLQRYHPHIFSATRYIIDEVSADARERAQRRLTGFADRVEFRRLVELEPSVEGIVFANELFDAFPVHRVTMRAGRFYELFVDLDDENGFIPTERDSSTPGLAAYLAALGIELLEGQIAEVNLEVEGWMRRAGTVLKRGYLVVVDYGAEASELYGGPHRREGTLRAFHQHRLAADLLARPGERDVTTTVNWTNVRSVGAEVGLQFVSLERLDAFLLRAGLLDQLERMASDASEESEAVILRSSARELILPGGMGESFQVLVQEAKNR